MKYGNRVTTGFFDRILVKRLCKSSLAPLRGRLKRKNMVGVLATMPVPVAKHGAFDGR